MYTRLCFCQTTKAENLKKIEFELNVLLARKSTGPEPSLRVSIDFFDGLKRKTIKRCVTEGVSKRVEISLPNEATKSFVRFHAETCGVPGHLTGFALLNAPEHVVTSRAIH